MRNSASMAMVAVLALIHGAAGQVRADIQLSYTTTGTFASSGTAVADYFQSSNAEVELKYTSNNQTVMAPATNVVLGVFTLTTLNAQSNGLISPDDDFSLLLTQTSPSAPGHTFASEIGGSVHVKNPDGSLTITFTAPYNATFANVTYTIHPSMITLSAPNGAPTTATLYADITVAATPEPSTAVMAASGGVLGLGFYLRRRKGATS